MVDKSANKWTQNLKSKVKQREEITVMSSLTDLCRIPKKKQIIGRFLRLFQDGIKNKTKRIALISEELVCLWQKLNFPAISKQQLAQKYLGWLMIISAIARRKRKNLKNNWKMFLIPQKLMGFG